METQRRSRPSHLKEGFVEAAFPIQGHGLEFENQDDTLPPNICHILDV
jgi:hypothetical protein